MQNEPLIETRREGTRAIARHTVRGWRGLAAVLAAAALTGCGSGGGSSGGAGAHFEFADVDGERFVFEITDPATIAHARDVLAGEEEERVRVMGTIVKAPATYNPPWHFHLDPATVDFFAVTAEVCDATIRQVEEHLDEVGGAFLPDRRWCPWSSTLIGEWSEPGPETRPRLAVAWDDPGGGGVVRALRSVAPFPFDTPALATGGDGLLRAAGRHLYVLSRAEASVTVVDAPTWTPLRVLQLGAGSTPVDIAVAGPRHAYVTRATATRLLRLDLETGARTESVDLAAFADPDGVPDLGTMTIAGDHLFVQIRRRSTETPGGQVEPPLLAVVDLRSEQLVDTDPAVAGTQAIALAGTAPKRKMEVAPGGEHLVVSASGDFHDHGGIEVVDLRHLRSRGLVVEELGGIVGGDLGAVAMATADTGFLTFSTDLDLSTHLKPFTFATGADPRPDLHLTLGYEAPALAVDRRTATLFLPERAGDAGGVHAFDARTGARLTAEPIPTDTPPTDLAVLP